MPKYPRELLEAIGEYCYIYQEVAMLSLNGWKEFCQYSDVTNPFLFNIAVRNKSLGLLKRIFKLMPEYVKPLNLDESTRAENMEMIEWLVFKGVKSAHAVSVAAGLGRLDLVKFLISNNSNPLSSAMVSAACGGHLKVIKYLHFEVGLKSETAAMDYAASNGHLEVIKFLHENLKEGCTSSAIDRACTNGHLSVVKFLHENRTEGCTHRAMDQAAAQGHFEIIKWLHSNRAEGCTPRAIFASAIRGHRHISKWLFENRPQDCKISVKYYRSFATTEFGYYSHIEEDECFKFLTDLVGTDNIMG